jgi:hypothetical protein
MLVYRGIDIVAIHRAETDFWRASKAGEGKGKWTCTGRYVGKVEVVL